MGRYRRRLDRKGRPLRRDAGSGDNRAVTLDQVMMMHVRTPESVGEGRGSAKLKRVIVIASPVSSVVTVVTKNSLGKMWYGVTIWAETRDTSQISRGTFLPSLSAYC